MKIIIMKKWKKMKENNEEIIMIMWRNIVMKIMIIIM